MTSINDLLKRKNNPVKEKIVPKKTSFSLKKKSVPESAPESESKKSIPLISESETLTSDNPFDSLADTLNNIDQQKPMLSTETSSEPLSTQSSESQFENPTIDDVSNFVFEEQPDETDEAIMHQFSTMLSSLSKSTGDQVPVNLAKNLKFIKTHAFLADILKPESISILVTALRKSYSFTVDTKTEKSTKKALQNKKLSEVSDSLGGFNF